MRTLPLETLLSKALLLLPRMLFHGPRTADFTMTTTTKTTKMPTARLSKPAVNITKRATTLMPQRSATRTPAG